MCIAIVKPEGKWITKETLAECFRSNPHGAGYAKIVQTEAGPKVEITKGFFSFDKFWESYSGSVSADDIALLHFRIKTSGKQDEANCHPFAIDNGALIHNGPCLNRTHCSGDKDMSDTAQFADKFVKTWDYDKVSELQPFIEAFIGSEKVAFLFNDGRYVICNEQNGLWEKGVWYSNTSFRPVVTSTYDGWYSRSSATGTSSASTSTAGSPASTFATGALKTAALQNPDKTVVVRFGINRDFECKYSKKIDDFVPMLVEIEGEVFVWAESMQAYVPRGVKNELSYDRRYVYEATDAAQKREGGPKMDVARDWIILTDVLYTIAQVRAWLVDAKPVLTLPSAAKNTADKADASASTVTK